MVGGEHAVLPLEQLEAHRRAGRARSPGAKRLVRRLEDHGGGRRGDGRHALDELGERHRHPVDRDGQPALEGDLQTRRFVQLGPARRAIPQRRLDAMVDAGVARIHGDDANGAVEGVRGGLDLRLVVLVAAVRDDGGPLDQRDLDERPRHERPGGRGPLGTGRGDAVAGELVARVEHVRAHGARGERRLADALELGRLADVERQGDDLGAERGCETWNRGKAVGAAGAAKHDATAHAGCPSPVNRSNRLTSALARRASGATTRTVSSPATVPTTSGRWASSMVTQSACARPRPVRSSTSCWTRSTRRRYSATARWSIVSAVLPFGAAGRPGGWYAPSAPPLTRPSSRMSRESVACVTSKPAARMLRRSCSWLRTGAR